MLDGIGLTDGETVVYVALLELSSASFAEVTERCPDVDVPTTIHRLEALGLVSRQPGSPARYAVAPPDVALEMLVRDRERELLQARVGIANLTQRYRAAQMAARPSAVVEVVTSREATLQRWEQLQRSARSQIRCFDRPPYVGDPSGNPIEEDLLRSGVTYRVVYHPRGLAYTGRLEGIQALIAQGEQARVAASVPVKMYVADDDWGLLPLEFAGTAESCLAIHKSSLLDTLIALFEQVWARAAPMHANGRPSVPPTTPTNDSATLLGLLAAGFTDTAIARQLGAHPRTVQRHVRALLEELDATTRFQAGLQAARRGWL